MCYWISLFAGHCCITPVPHVITRKKGRKRLSKVNSIKLSITGTLELETNKNISTNIYFNLCEFLVFCGSFVIYTLNDTISTLNAEMCKRTDKAINSIFNWFFFCFLYIHVEFECHRSWRKKTMKLNKNYV